MSRLARDARAGRRPGAARPRGATPRRRAARRRRPFVRARRPHDPRPPSRRGSGGRRRTAAQRRGESLELPAFAAIAHRVAEPAVHDRTAGSSSCATSATCRRTRRSGSPSTSAAPLDTSRLVLVDRRRQDAGRAGEGDARRRTSRWSARSRRRPSDGAAGARRSDAGLKLSAGAARHITDRLGEDAGRVPELVELLRATYGDGATLDVDDVDAYLGELGTAGRFDLANAIDRGDVADGARGAAPHAHRDERRGRTSRVHPLAVMAMLTCALPTVAAPRRPVDRHEGTGRRGARDAQRRGRALPARRGAPARQRRACARRWGCSRRPNSTCAARARIDERDGDRGARGAARAPEPAAQPRRRPPRGRGARGARAKARSARGALHQPRDAPRRLVAVDDALLARLGEPLLGEAQALGRVLVTGVDGLGGALHPGLQLGADALVARRGGPRSGGCASSGS